jgi:hypothetical protein
LTFTCAGDRFQKNSAALSLLHALEFHDRPATDKEPHIRVRSCTFGESALLNRLFRSEQAAGRSVRTLSETPSSVPTMRHTCGRRRELPSPPRSTLFR